MAPEAAEAAHGKGDGLKVALKAAVLLLGHRDPRNEVEDQLWAGEQERHQEKDPDHGGGQAGEIGQARAHSGDPSPAHITAQLVARLGD